MLSQPQTGRADQAPPGKERARRRNLRDRVPIDPPKRIQACAVGPHPRNQALAKNNSPSYTVQDGFHLLEFHVVTSLKWLAIFTFILTQGIAARKLYRHAKRKERLPNLRADPVLKEPAYQPPKPSMYKKKLLNFYKQGSTTKGTLLLMKDRAKIVIPKPALSKIIAELHRAHSCINKTYTTARQLYYWPHMKNDIEQAIAACSLCQADRPTQARPIASGTNPGSVNEIGTDLFFAIGKKWLATVDRYSGYAWLTQLHGTHTAKITKELSNIFNSFHSLTFAKITPYNTNCHSPTTRNTMA